MTAKIGGSMKLFIATLLATFSLLGCGGGGGDSPTTRGGGPVSGAKVPNMPMYNQKPATQAEAARFLHQATLGVTEADITAVMQKGYGPWLEEQMNTSLTPSISAKRWVNQWKGRDGSIFNLNLNRNVFWYC